MANVFAVGVGPGSPDCITAKVEKIIRDCDVVIGYQYTLDTIKHLLVDKETVIITMSNQEEAYQRAKETLGNKTRSYRSLKFDIIPSFFLQLIRLCAL